MRKIRQSTAKNVMVLMVAASNHVTGLAGLTLTITASKNGGAFAAIAPTVVDRGDGWYSIALTAAHADTVGDLALHITGAAADPADVVLLVENDWADKYLLYKKITNPATGVMTVYEPDGTTVAFSANVFKDASGLIPYDGTGAERIERMV
jgi:hypothetical protein